MKCRVKFFKPKINPHVSFFPEPLVNTVLERSSKCDKKFCVFCWEKVANKVAIFCHITMFLALANTSFLSPTLTSNRQKWATSFLLFSDEMNAIVKKFSLFTLKSNMAGVEIYSPNTLFNFDPNSLSIWCKIGKILWKAFHLDDSRNCALRQIVFKEHPSLFSMQSQSSIWFPR